MHLNIASPNTAHAAALRTADRGTAALGMLATTDLGSVFAAVRHLEFDASEAGAALAQLPGHGPDGQQLIAIGNELGRVSRELDGAIRSGGQRGPALDTRVEFARLLDQPLTDAVRLAQLAASLLPTR